MSCNLCCTRNNICCNTLFAIEKGIMLILLLNKFWFTLSANCIHVQKQFRSIIINIIISTRWTPQMINNLYISWIIYTTSDWIVDEEPKKLLNLEKASLTSLICLEITKAKSILLFSNNTKCNQVKGLNQNYTNYFHQLNFLFPSTPLIDGGSIRR